MQGIGGPQKYHAKALQELRRKFRAVASDGELRTILQRCDCLSELESAVQSTSKL